MKRLKDYTIGEVAATCKKLSTKEKLGCFKCPFFGMCVYYPCHYDENLLNRAVPETEVVG